MNEQQHALFLLDVLLNPPYITLENNRVTKHVRPQGWASITSLIKSCLMLLKGKITNVKDVPSPFVGRKAEIIKEG